MFGIPTCIALGCSFDRMDEVLAPYAEMNYKKHMADASTTIFQNQKHMLLIKQIRTFMTHSKH